MLDGEVLFCPVHVADIDLKARVGCVLLVRIDFRGAGDLILPLKLVRDIGLGRDNLANPDGARRLLVGVGPVRAEVPEVVFRCRAVCPQFCLTAEVGRKLPVSRLGAGKRPAPQLAVGPTRIGQNGRRAVYAPLFATT